VIGNNVEIDALYPELLLCHRSGEEAGKRIYHPELACASHGLVFVQDKPDIHIINGREYFAYPEDVIFIKPGDTISSYSYGTNYNLFFTLSRDERIDTVYDLINKFKTHYMIKNSEKDAFSGIVKEIFECFEDEDPPIRLKVKSLILYLLHMLCADLSIPDPVIAKSIKYIEANIGAKVTIDDLANEAGLSKRHYHKLFRESYGTTPIEYINRRKMKIARELLEMNKLMIYQIAHELGYESPEYFSRLFKTTYGVSPRKYTQSFM
jgi:AraC family transcriptional regulator, transcriptional activator for feuABC-ybbA operon